MLELLMRVVAGMVAIVIGLGLFGLLIVRGARDLSDGPRERER